MSSLAEKQSCSSTTSTLLGVNPADSKHFLAANRDMSYPTCTERQGLFITMLQFYFQNFLLKNALFLTILMQLFSSNEEDRSVTISWATISTAWFSRWCFLTKASLAKTAAAAPSEVGLREKTCHRLD